MSKINTIPMRTDRRFKELVIDSIKINRQKKFPSERIKPMRSARITLAMTRHPLMKTIKLDIEKNDLK